MSLRARLLIATWLAVFAIGGVSAILSYRIAKYETEELLDDQMRRVARIVLARQGSNEAADTAVAAIPPDYDKEDDLHVVVRDAHGNEVYRTTDNVALPALDTQGFTSMAADGDQFRVFVARAGDQRVVVAESTEERRESAVGAALSALLPALLIIPALGIVITLVVRAQLRPIARIADAIASRPPLALDALPTTSLPAEIRPLIQEINQLLVRLKSAIHREQRFVSDAAHALRTPLTALQLQVDVLDGSKDSEERARRVAELRAGMRRVVRFTGQLLALARHESADANAEAHTDLAEIFSDLQAVYGAVAAERGVTLRRAAPVNAQIRGSSHQLILILGNLLDNALRYAPRDSSIELLSHVDAHTVHLQVRDDGPGLPAEELERVFERFYRAPADSTEGNGLGLATVAAVVERLGGRAWLENRTDHTGLVANVSLPRADAGSGSPEQGAQS